jgi:hypothetical protein
MGKIIWLDYGMLLLVNPRALCSSSGTEGSWNSFLYKSNVLRVGGWNNGCDMTARELGRGNANTKTASVNGQGICSRAGWASKVVTTKV